MQKGKASIEFKNPPRIVGKGNVAGTKEGEGPLGNLFDRIEEDPMFGKETWEEAESQMQKEAAQTAIANAGLKSEDIRYLLAGDLLGQLIATSFGLMELDIPLFGLYGACSTMGEAMTLGSILVDGGYADRTLALASSHFASAEKQFRFPLEYGNQRPLSASWTVTGSGAVVLAKEGSGPRITGITPGKIVDMGLKDSMNMGACMAPVDVKLTPYSKKGVNKYWRQIPLSAQIYSAVSVSHGLAARSFFLYGKAKVSYLKLKHI